MSTAFIVKMLELADQLTQSIPKYFALEVNLYVDFKLALLVIALIP